MDPLRERRAMHAVQQAEAAFHADPHDKGVRERLLYAIKEAHDARDECLIAMWGPTGCPDGGSSDLSHETGHDIVPI